MVFPLAAGFAALVSISPAALADAKSVTIKVKVLGADGKPAADARVYVRKWPDPYNTFTTSESADAKDDGSFSDATDKNGKPFPPDTYEITAWTDGGYAKTIVHIAPDAKSPVVLTLGPMPGTFLGHATNAAEAAQGGDSSGYEQSVKDAQNSIKFEEKVADAAQQAADDFARDSGLQIKDLRGVTKDIERASKLPENLQDKEQLEKLYDYRAKLQEVQNLRSNIEKEKKQLADLRPPEKKVGVVPSACPEGQSGGLLAGGINSVFGTDLAGVCDDKQPHRRDTDRPAGGHGEKHERRD